MKNRNVKKWMLLSAIFLSCTMMGWSQRITTPSTSPSQTMPSKGTPIDTNAYIENRLVQLALRQPNYHETESNTKIAQYQLTKAQNSWLDLLSISLNYNDQTFAKKNTATTYVYPKYFFGLTVPLGLIFSRSSDIKVAKETVEIYKGREVEMAKNIKADVLTKYRQYKANEQLIALQNQLINDQQAMFMQVEQKFKDGTATIEAYNLASKEYNSEVVKAVNLQLQQDLLEIDIEKIIGIPLEDVVKNPFSR